MRILFINRCIGMFRGGGETYAINIAKELRKLGCEIRFIVSSPWFRKVRYRIEDFETEYVPSPYLRDFAQQMSAGNSYFEKIPVRPLRNFSQKGYRFIAGKIFKFDSLKFQNDIFDYLKKRRRNYDIVQVFGYPVLASQIVKELKKPLVIRFPGPPATTYAKEILECNAVISSGDAFLRIRDTIAKDVIDIPPGVDSQKFKPTAHNVRKQYNISLYDKLLLFVGRFVPLKNLPFLIEGTVELIKSDSKIRLLLVGEGPLYGQIVNLVSKLNIKDKVIFVGKVASDNLATYYSTADVFAITSNYDNFPNAVLEAMSCGLPIIGTKVGGIPQQVEDGVNGFLIENNNISEFKEAVLKLVNDRKLCKEMGRRNREMVKVKYDWSKSAKRFLEIYEGILKGVRVYQ